MKTKITALGQKILVWFKEEVVGAGKNMNWIIGIIIMEIGILILTLSLFADLIGIGARPGFGGYQLRGLLIGLMTLIYGLLKTVFSRKDLGLLVFVKRVSASNHCKHLRTIVLSNSTSVLKRMKKLWEAQQKLELPRKIKENYNIAFFFIIIVGALLIRWSVLDFESGDYKWNIRVWYDFIATHPFFEAMKHQFSDYNPPYTYLLAVATFLPIAKLYSIKLFSILFDFVAAILGYLILRTKYKTGSIPLLVFGAILFAPTVFVNSALWAQCDVIYTAGLLAAIYCLLKGKHGLALCCFSTAFSFKMQSLFLFPLFFVLFLKPKLSDFY